jgi:D-arabinose 1-dehydrogenase-like Zn-dependent alcohol dehydrogenase
VLRAAVPTRGTGVLARALPRSTRPDASIATDHGLEARATRQCSAQHTLITGKRRIQGWYSGTSIDSQDTLAFSQFAGVKSMNEIYPMEKAPEAYARMMSGKARFRVVLTM